MPTDIFSNSGETTVASGGTTAPAAGTTQTWTVVSSVSFPAASNTATPATQFYVTDPALPSEIIKVTHVSGATWSVTRGAESTTPVAHTVGFTVHNIIPASFLSRTSAELSEFNVRNYNAKGDGVTIDDVAVQAALDAAYAAGGGIVRFPPGTYNWATSWIIRGNTHIRCDAQTRIARTVNAFGYVLQNGANGETQSGYTGHSNISVHGGIWDMKGGTLTTGAAAFGFGHATNIEFRDLTILDVPDDHAMDCTAISGLRVRDCRFLGMSLTSGDPQYIEALQIDTALTGTFPPFGNADSTPCRDVVVEGCYFGVSGSAGTQAWPRGVGSHSSVAGSPYTDIVIRGNNFVGLTYAAIPVKGAEGLVISGNNIDACAGGVYLVSDATSVQDIRDIVVSNNTFRNMGNVQHAITVSPASGAFAYGVVIADNVVDTSSAGTNSKGIQIARGNDVAITGNVFKATGHSAIVTDDCEDMVISNNIIASPAQRGIDCLNTDILTISNNNVRNAQFNGIYVAGGSDVLVKGNNVKGAGRATNVTYFGIRMNSSTAGATVTANRVRKFGSGNEVLDGISFSSSCTAINCWGNDIADTGLDYSAVTFSDSFTNVPALLLQRTTTQAIATSTDTAISWSSATKNTGPTSWWSSGSATQIVMPWAGLYQVSVGVNWASNATGIRVVHLNETTSIAVANMRGGCSIAGSTAEAGRSQTFTQTIYVATAGTVFVVPVWQSSGGSLNIDDAFTNSGIPLASCGVVYLGNI